MAREFVAIRLRVLSYSASTGNVLYSKSYSCKNGIDVRQHHVDSTVSTRAAVC